MYNKTIFCTALALVTIAPLSINTVHATSNTSVKQTVTDTVISAKVKALYAQSSMIKNQKINVTTVKQTVVLTGQVKTKSQYERAITLADSIDGVKSINTDNLTVKASRVPLKDSYITAKVKGVFLKEKIFGAKDIEFWPVKVETKDSVVYLSGKVSSNEELNNLTHLAQNIQGVSSVNSSIKVQ